MRSRRAPHFLIAMALGVLAGGAGCHGFALPNPTVRYIAFGDSTTAGDTDRDYCDILGDLLGVEPAMVVNEGHGGETTSEGLPRLRRLLRQQRYPEAKVLLYWEGGNDLIEFIQVYDPLLISSPGAENYPYQRRLFELLDETQANMEEALRLARNAGWRVLIATYFPLRENTNRCDPMPFDVMLAEQAMVANTYLALLNQRIRRAALSAGATLVDVEAVGGMLIADPANYADCNHLSAKGNEIVAREFFKAIR